MEESTSRKNILIVFDDVIKDIDSQAGAKHSSFLIDLIYNRRHIIKNCIFSFIITS
jgi:hypothetical protein